MADEQNRAGRFQALIGGLVLAATILAFSTSPLSDHANSTWLAKSGFMLAGATFAFYQLEVRPSLDRKLKWPAWAMAVIGVFGLSWTFADAIVTAEDYDGVCATQQQRMLNGDGAGLEIFRALKCDYSR